MGVQTAKLASLGILFAMCVGSGVILPYVILRVLSSKCKTTSLNRVLGLMNCLSGGVFLSTSLLTLLPEAREAAEEAFPALTEKYPLTELLLACGFLLILIIECIATTLILGRRKVSDNPTTQAELQLDKYSVPDVATKDNHQNSTYVTTIDIPIVENGCTKATNGTVSKIEVTNQNKANKPDNVTIETEEISHVHPSELTNLRSYVIIIALSIHMLFDGLGLGLLGDDTNVWSVLGALSIHKLLIFFSTGLNLCENNTLKKFVIAMVYMSFVSPIGVGVGIAMTSYPESPVLLTISAVLQGVAVGTFLYVAILEVLAKEFQVHNDSWRIYKSFSAVAGCAVFAVIQYAMPE